MITRISSHFNYRNYDKSPQIGFKASLATIPQIALEYLLRIFLNLVKQWLVKRLFILTNLRNIRVCCEVLRVTCRSTYKKVLLSSGNFCELN